MTPLPSAPSGNAPESPLAGLDIVTILGLRVWTVIGVYPHERGAAQEVLVDAWIGTDTAPAAADDDIEKAIDYGAVAAAFRAYANEAEHELVETLAEACAQIALERFGAQAVRIRVQKQGAVPGADAVGVTIERPRVPSATRRGHSVE